MIAKEYVECGFRLGTRLGTHKKRGGGDIRPGRALVRSEAPAPAVRHGPNSSVVFRFPSRFIPDSPASSRFVRIAGFRDCRSASFPWPFKSQQGPYGARDSAGFAFRRGPRGFTSQELLKGQEPSATFAANPMPNPQRFDRCGAVHLGFAFAPWAFHRLPLWSRFRLK